MTVLAELDGEKVKSAIPVAASPKFAEVLARALGQKPKEPTA
jgi:hypothetical protein